jgi:hypothetical protein
MSKELPYFKFFPNEWLSGDVTLEQMELQGVFINVCAIYWSKECRVAMARLSQRYGEAIARLLENGLLKEKEGFAVINFLDEQWVELSQYHQINSNNGKKGAEVRWGKNGEANGEAIALRREEKRLEEKTTNIAFDVFWELYEKKVGDKDKLVKKWKSLSDSERNAIIEFIPKYKLSQPDKKYRKNPETFFNNKSWNDELLSGTNSTAYNPRIDFTKAQR